MTLLTLTDLTVRRGRRTVVDAATLTVNQGEVVGLIGPNGAGKSSLMRAAQGLLPARGHSSLTRMSARARARHVAWLPQGREIAWPVTVETLVALGRTPYIAGGRTLGDDDRAAVDRAIDRMGLDPLRDTRATELSGGEQARALMARVLAQETPLLIADEPAAGLDPAHQLSLMRLFRRLADEGRGVLVALHDLTLAARYCTRLVVLDRGRLAADAPPRQVLSGDLPRDVFGVRGVWSTIDGTEDFHLFEVAP